ncbi:MAG: glycerophosphodiester phosphodiesterase family protein [Microbacterium sp.]
MTSTAPLVIAHRGASGYRPEHSRSAYELAIRMGCDAVEPDVVATRDGVLVVRHENEISGTTDVADRPEFADRRRTARIDGVSMTGWFTEDFTWDELSTLTVRERIPEVRPESARFDGTEPILRLRDVLDLVAGAAPAEGRTVGVVIEIKHDAHFRSIGIDLAALVADDVRSAGWGGPARPVTVEAFEQSPLRRLRRSGFEAERIFLVEAKGAPADLVRERGADAPTYAELITPAGLDALAGVVDGISVAKSLVLAPDRLGRVTRPGRIVEDAHARGLRALTWTCRPENRFLLRQFRGTGGASAFGDYAAEWRVIRDSGIDGVFVDHTDLGVAQFRG